MSTYGYRPMLLSSPLRMKTCLGCSLKFEGPPAAKRCSVCRVAHDKAAQLRENEKRNRLRVPIPRKGRPQGSASPGMV